MKIKYIVGVLVIMCLSLSYSVAQDSPQRIEIEAKVRSDNYNIIPVGNKGVIIFNETKEKDKSNKKSNDVMWYFTKYNTDFEEDWTKQIGVIKKLNFKGFDVNDKYMYLMFQEPNSKAADYQMVQIDIVSGKNKVVTGKVPNSKITDICAIDDKVYFGGGSEPTTGQMTARMCLTYAGCCIPVFFGSMIIKTNPILYHIDFANSKATPKSFTYEGSAKITDIILDKTNNTASVVMMNKYDATGFKLNLQEYSPKGKKISTDRIMSKGGNVLLNGKVSSTGNKEKIIIGTYAKPKAKQGFMAKIAQSTSGASLSGYYSQGIYFTRLDDGKQKLIKYYSFSKFKGFKMRKGSSTKGKAPSKKKKKKKKGSSSRNTISYRLLVHDIIIQNDEYIMVGEAYYPEYHYEYYTTTNAQGVTTTHTKKVFDGYRYTHAIAAGFNKEGEKVWDHSFPIFDILTFNLKERVNVMVSGDDVVLAYNNGGSIKSKIINGTEIKEGKKSTKIATGGGNDKVKSNYASDISFWYDDYYIAYGYQKIKDKGKRSGSKKKRTVFYFNKIALQ